MGNAKQFFQPIIINIFSWKSRNSFNYGTARDYPVTNFRSRQTNMFECLSLSQPPHNLNYWFGHISIVHILMEAIHFITFYWIELAVNEYGTQWID